MKHWFIISVNNALQTRDNAAFINVQDLES